MLPALEALAVELGPHLLVQGVGPEVGLLDGGRSGGVETANCCVELARDLALGRNELIGDRV